MMLPKSIEEYLFSKAKDPNIFKLGRLCKNKHDDYDKESIRYKSTGRCLRCLDEYYFDNCAKIQAKYQGKKLLTKTSLTSAISSDSIDGSL